jgi:hypothetical protein
MKEMIDDIFDRFHELMVMDLKDPKNKASQRIKILIKNMFDNKASNWSKSKESDKSILTKDEVAAQVMKQESDKRRQESGFDKGRNDDKPQRGGDRD